MVVQTRLIECEPGKKGGSTQSLAKRVTGVPSIPRMLILVDAKHPLKILSHQSKRKQKHRKVEE
jgi:hypothetical protein